MCLLIWHVLYKPVIACRMARRQSTNCHPPFFSFSFRYHVEQAVSPALSYRSMTSDENADNMDLINGSSTRYKQDKVYREAKISL